jgi:hypothetical protein
MTNKRCFTCTFLFRDFSGRPRNYCEFWHKWVWNWRTCPKWLGERLSFRKNKAEHDLFKQDLC